MGLRLDNILLKNTVLHGMGLEHTVWGWHWTVWEWD